MTKPSFIKTPTSITVFYNGKLYTANAKNKAYAEVDKLIRANRWSEIPGTIDRMEALANKVATHNATAKKHNADKVIVRDRRVYLIAKDGSESRLVGFEVDRLLSMMDEGHDIHPLCNFIARVRQNPSESIRARLYEFMEYGNMPLTEDGSFLAYKVVGPNYLDKHSRTINNSVGKRVTMPRAKVDDNDNRTCSSGLHACSKEYVRFFLSGSQDHLMVLKIAPEDVVSIPTDYNNTKLRCCAYDVIAEIKAVDDPEFFGKVVYNPKAKDDGDDWANDPTVTAVISLDS
jgi:hypothetical protein